jgi:thiol-disulfide isomerase/thioredoxin
MKRILNLLSNIILICGLVFLALKKAPSIIRQFETEGTHSPNFSISTLDGKLFDLRLQSSPLVIVFWTTWCGPCEVELARINRMIRSNELDSQSVLAISLQEEPTLVEKIIKDRNYLFRIGLDSNGQVGNLFGIAGTPTIILLDKSQRIRWMTSGLSPTLEYHIGKLLRESSIYPSMPNFPSENH